MIAVKCEDSIFWSPMQASSLTLTLATVQNAPIATPIRIELLPVSGSAGGQHMRTPEFNLNGATTCRVSGIPSFDVGTNYQITVDAENYQLTSFFKRLIPGEQVADALKFLIDPSRVKGINAKPFDELPDARLREILNNSKIQLPNQGTELAGPALYNALEDKQKACLLNIAAKANHTSADSVWALVQSLRRIEQDRCFAFVDGNTETILKASSLYVPAGTFFHEPMPGFTLGNSFKSKGAHATLQVTLMKNQDGQVAADIDIDEASGGGHLFEVFRNKVTGGLTNPYQVLELMLLGDPNDSDHLTVVDPGYSLIFS